MSPADVKLFFPLHNIFHARAQRTMSPLVGMPVKQVLLWGAQVEWNVRRVAYRLQSHKPIPDPK